MSKRAKHDVERRLAPAEALELAHLLKGRVSWKGQAALAEVIGVDRRTIMPAIRRKKLSRGVLRKIRAHLARLAIATSGSVPLVVVHAGVQ